MSQTLWSENQKWYREQFRKQFEKEIDKIWNEEREGKTQVEAERIEKIEQIEELKLMSDPIVWLVFWNGVGCVVLLTSLWFM